VSGGDRTLDELRAENARLWEENHRLRAERRDIEHMERQVATMESSLSWQITSPLRAAKTLYVKVQRRLEATNG
jgi:hypothetical protein